jgi:hypothetical protein
MKKQLLGFLAISLMLMPLFLTVYTIPLAGDQNSNDTITQNQEEDINEGNNLNDMNPLSSAFPSFTRTTLSGVVIETSRNLTALSVYDIRPSGGECPDIFVGTDQGAFYLFEGIQQPFDGVLWTKDASIPTGSASEIRSIIPMHIKNIEDNATDIYVSNKLGYQYNYYQDDKSRRSAYTTDGFSTPGNQGDTALEIDGFIPTSSIKTELGGKYDLDDEIVVGLSNGHIVYVATENISNSLSDKYIEKTISTDFSSYIRDIAVGDMNNDGDKDVVSAFATGGIYTFENDGTPGDGAWSSRSTDTLSATAIALSDLNLDGKLDLIAGTSGGEVYIYQNNGNPHGSSFTAVQKIDVNQNIRDIKSADIDLDGDMDIICALENYTIMTLENPLHMPSGSTELNPFASGMWRSYNLPSLSSGVPNLIEIVDLDTDGDLDIVTVMSNGFVYLLQNGWDHSVSNDFTFGPKEHIATTAGSDRFNKIAYGDLDNDGNTDIVVGTISTGDENATITVFKNPGSSIFRNFTIPNTWSSYTAYAKKSSKIYGISLNDIDKNGYLDILFIENSTGDPEFNAIRGIKNNGNPWVNYWDNNNATILLKVSDYNIATSELLILENLDMDNKKEFIWAGRSGTTYFKNITAFRQQSNPWLPWNDAINITWNPSGNPIEKLIIGYINDDNYKDIVFSDSMGHIYVTDGRPTIGSLEGSRIRTALNIEATSKVTSIAINDRDKNYQQDIAFSMSGLNWNVHSLIPRWTWPYTFNNHNRTQFFDSIRGMICVDLNKNGLKDYLLWTESALYTLKGNIGDYDEETCTLVENFPEGSIKDVKVSDFDLDGDPDFIVSVHNLTSSDLYYFPNRKHDDIIAPTLTLAIKPVYSANKVVINATANEELYAAPRVRINVGASTTYGIMTPNGTSLTWTYTHNVVLNGTHNIVVNCSDISGNFVQKSGVFFGDKILPVIAVSAIGAWRPGFSNSSVTIQVTNTTDRVGNDKIGLNITHPVLGTHIFTMVNYNPTEHAFIYTYPFVTVNGVYTVGVNASDQYFVDYRYSTITFQGDRTAPHTVEVYEPSEDTRDKYLSNKLMHFNATFDEPIIHLDVVAWRTGEGNLAPPYSYYTDYSGETVVNFTFDLPRGVKGDMNLTFTFVDRAGNYNNYTKNVSIIVFPPVYCTFFFIDPNTEEQYITETTLRIIAIQWSGDNFSTLVYRINDGDWSVAIAYNHPERMMYPIDLGTTGGELTVTVRFLNEDDYTDISAVIIYNPPIAQIPWQWIIISLVVVVGAGVLIKFSRPKTKERSWKEFMDK